MAIDKLNNFIKGELASGINSTSTTLYVYNYNNLFSKLPTLDVGEGFNITIFNSTDFNDPSDDSLVEIVRCTDYSLNGSIIEFNITRPSADNNYLGEGPLNIAVNHNSLRKKYIALVGISQKTINDIKSELLNIQNEIIDTETQLQGEIDNLEANKADKTYVDNQDNILQVEINTKADKTYVDSQDDILQVEIDNLEINKADKTYVDNADTALQQQITGLNTSKADESDLLSINEVLQNQINDLDNTKTDKTYVDQEIIDIDSSVVHNIGDETVGGIKTFTELPQSSSSPTLNTELTPKSYVDTEVAKVGSNKFWQARVNSLSQDVPEAPTQGDRYIVPVGATGSWLGKDNYIATYVNTIWEFTSPTEGMMVYVEDINRYYCFQTNWMLFSIFSGNVTYPTWHSDMLYNIDDMISYNGIIYISINEPNIGKTPGVEVLYWKQLGSDDIDNNSAIPGDTTSDALNNAYVFKREDSKITQVNENDEVDLKNGGIVANYQDLPINIGVVQLPTVTKNVDGTITVGDDGIINFCDQVDGRGNIKQFENIIGDTLTLIDNTISFLYADYNSGSPIYKVSNTNEIFLTNATLAPVIRISRHGTRLHFEEYDEYGTLTANKLVLKDAILNGARRLNGLTLSTEATRKSVVSSGQGVFCLQYYLNMEENRAGVTGSIYELYPIAGVWSENLVTEYDSSYYSDGTNRIALNNNKYVAKYFWRDIGDDNEVYYIHGKQYNTESQAFNENVPVAPFFMTGHSVYVGKIVIQKNSLNGIAYPRNWEGSVQSATVSNHNDLSGIQGGTANEYYHLTYYQSIDLTDGGISALHKHTLLSTPDGTSNFVYTDNSGTLHIDGDITQNGAAYETHAEQVYTKKGLIITRDGAISGLGVGEYTGFQAKLYDGVNDGMLVFDKDGIARVGDVGSLQALATRQDTPIDTGISYWNNSASRFDTSSQLTWDDANRVLNIKNTTGADVELILDRNVNANWKFLSSAGNLMIQSDYTTAKVAYYDVLKLFYNTGNATLKGKLSSAGLNDSTLTASQLVGTDASKNLISLSTATYPSLTELSYVKGVTSSIQTQLNGKQNALNGTGFVKISGATISYDNSTYLTTASAANTYLPKAGGTMTGKITLLNDRYVNEPTFDLTRNALDFRNSDAVGINALWFNDLSDAGEGIFFAKKSSPTLLTDFDRFTAKNGTWYFNTTELTTTELGYLDGVTSNIQTQLNGKVPTTGASHIQSAGRSSSWGNTNGTSTGAFNAIMGTGDSATWLISGTSGGTFRGGIQLLDGGGTMRLYTSPTAYVNITGTTISGNLTGNVTGNVTGNTTGNTNVTNYVGKEFTSLQSGFSASTVGGGDYSCNLETQTGYLKITLPVSWTSTMMKFAVDIFEYATGATRTIYVGGYNYLNSSAWYNCSAYQSSEDTNSYSVRFGHDGTKCAIYIGEVNTAWKYIQVRVRDFLGGFGNATASYFATGWNIGVTNTLGTISITKTAETVYHPSDADTSATASKLVLRDSAADINCRLVRQNYADQSTISGGMVFRTNNSTDNYLRVCNSTSAIRTYLGVDLVSGSTSVGGLKYNGTTNAAGTFYGGTTTPTGSNRLNYSGYFYPTYINLTGSGDTTTAATHYFVETGSDGYVRPKTLANVRTEIVTRDAVNAAASKIATSNVVLGTNAGNSLSTGYDNTLIGVYTGNSLSTGYGNTLIGKQSGYLITTASNNTFVGKYSGWKLTTGEYNIAIGYDIGASDPHNGSNNLYIGRGYLATANENNVIRIRNYNSAYTSCYIQGIYGQTSASGVAVLINGSDKLGTTTSSIRYKENVVDMADYSSSILNLRPVMFDYKDKYDDEGNLLEVDKHQPGLIAEEVAEVMPELVAYDTVKEKYEIDETDESGKTITRIIEVDKMDENGNYIMQPETVRYLNLIPLMLNEIKKLREEVEELKSK